MKERGSGLIFQNPGFYGSDRLDRNYTRDHRLLPADPTSVGGKMRMGHQRVDLGHLARREHSTLDLLLNSRRGIVKYCADKQYGSDRDNDCPRSQKQYRLCVSPIGDRGSHKNVTQVFGTSFYCSRKERSNM